MSAFNPDEFLDAQFNDANSTVSIPVPAGEYAAYIEEVKTRAWTSTKDPSKSGIALDIKYNIDDESVKEALGRTKVTVNQSIMLDLTDAGTLDMGKGRNVSLGRLREAAGLNVPGKPFSFRQLEGQPVKVRVEHRVYQPEGGEAVIMADVKGVAKLA